MQWTGDVVAYARSTSTTGVRSTTTGLVGRTQLLDRGSPPATDTRNDLHVQRRGGANKPRRSRHRQPEPRRAWRTTSSRRRHESGRRADAIRGFNVAQQTAATDTDDRWLRGQTGNETSGEHDQLYRERGRAGRHRQLQPVYVKAAAVQVHRRAATPRSQNAQRGAAHGMVYVGANDGMLHAFDAVHRQRAVGLRAVAW